MKTVLKKIFEQNRAVNHKERLHVRVDVNCLVKYRKVSDSKSSDFKMTNAINISEGGLLFKTYEDLPASSTIVLHVDLLNDGQSIETFAKILHSQKVSGPIPVAHVGVVFLDLAEKDRQLIRSYVTDAMKHPLGRKLVKKIYWWQFWKIRRVKPVEGTQNTFFTTVPEKTKKKR